MLKFYHFKKHTDGDHYYLDSDEFFRYVNESDKEFAQWYDFVNKYVLMSNWYNTHTSPAMGDTEYARLSGWIDGFMYARGLETEDCGDYVVIKCNSKKLIAFDKIALPEWEIATRRENAKILRDMLGG